MQMSIDLTFLFDMTLSIEERVGTLRSIVARLHDRDNYLLSGAELKKIGSIMERLSQVGGQKLITRGGE